MTDKRELSKLFQAFSKMLETMTEEEYKQFLSGELQFSFVHERKKKEQIQKASPEDLQAIISQLRLSKSREEARQILQGDERMQLKDNLTQIAKLLKVHIIKQDKRDEIENKIIEFVIGSKLRSEAIQGVNLKSSSISGS
ncbi:MAG: hypothetical protein HDKAJFGB_03658 [Anaerolineae bacterium]|nr:hypothetical protein [Anaerolineae bacterium]